jgi:hypothetical protein
MKEDALPTIQTVVLAGGNAHQDPSIAETHCLPID